MLISSCREADLHRVDKLTVIIAESHLKLSWTGRSSLNHSSDRGSSPSGSQVKVTFWPSLRRSARDGSANDGAAATHARISHGSKSFKQVQYVFMSGRISEKQSNKSQLLPICVLYGAINYLLCVLTDWLVISTFFARHPD